MKSWDQRWADIKEKLRKSVSWLLKPVCQFLYRYSYCFVPYYTAGRVLLPGNFSTTAVAVPLDGEYVISAPLKRGAFQALLKRFDTELPRFQSMVETLKPNMNLDGVPMNEADPVTPFIANRYFGCNDAEVLVALLAHFQPKRYVEIGCGNSTRYARYAIKKHDLPMKITCIDPSPRSPVQGVADEIVMQSVVDMDPAFVDMLETNDVFFFDGSHLTFHGTDTVTVILDLLPRLKPGVLVHFHDIYLPYEYIEACDKCFWSEQYMLAAFLMHNDAFEVVYPHYYLHKKGLAKEGVSFWLRRK